MKQFVGYRRLPSAPGAPRGGPESSHVKKQSPEYSVEEKLALPRNRFAPAKYLHSASWVALVKQVVSDAESDAIIAVVKRSQFLWFVAKVESGL